MRRSLAAVVLFLGLVGCGGSDTSNPVAACDSFVTAACNRASACMDLGTTSVSQCITNGEANVGCATAVCPAGTTFNSSAASQCVNDVNAESCTDIGNGVTPASCSTGCQ